MKKTFYKYAILMDGEVRYSILGAKLSESSGSLFLGDIEMDMGNSMDHHAELLNIKHNQEWAELRSGN